MTKSYSVIKVMVDMNSSIIVEVNTLMIYSCVIQSIHFKLVLQLQKIKQVHKPSRNC